MSSQNLFVLVGLPSQAREIIGEANLRRLVDAHPQVRVDIVESPERFATRVSEADAVIVWRFFHLPPQALARDTRLRWVQVIQAGVDPLLTPELIAAEHITITATKGPMGPLMAEHIVLLMLALARDLRGFLQDQAEHRWRSLIDERSMTQMFAKTIAILGVGTIGAHLA